MSRRGRQSGGFGKFLVGGLLGAIIGFLISPKRAQQVRQALFAPAAQPPRLGPSPDRMSAESATEAEPAAPPAPFVASGWAPSAVAEPEIEEIPVAEEPPAAEPADIPAEMAPLMEQAPPEEQAPTGEPAPTEEPAAPVDQETVETPALLADEPPIAYAPIAEPPVEAVTEPPVATPVPEPMPLVPFTGWEPVDLKPVSPVPAEPELLEVDETTLAEEATIVDEAAVVDEAAIVDEAPMIAEEAPAGVEEAVVEIEAFAPAAEAPAEAAEAPADAAVVDVEEAPAPAEDAQALEEEPPAAIEDVEAPVHEAVLTEEPPLNGSAPAVEEVAPPEPIESEPIVAEAETTTQPEPVAEVVEAEPTVEAEPVVEAEPILAEPEPVTEAESVVGEAVAVPAPEPAAPVGTFAPADLKARIEETRRRIQRELEQPFVHEPAAEAEPAFEETVAFEEPSAVVEPMAPVVPIAEPAAEAFLEEAEEQPVEAQPVEAPAPEPAAQEDGTFDHEAMRRRIEETRNRLKAKAFDAMMGGETLLLGRDSDLSKLPATPAVDVDTEVDESIESTLTEEDI